MKNRMRELRTCGTVRGEGHEVLAYSEKIGLSWNACLFDQRVTIALQLVDIVWGSGATAGIG
jgi:hypothetical protein